MVYDNIKISIAFLCCFFASPALGRSGEFCFPIGTPDTTTVYPELTQGRPGKVGPPGLPGQKGQRGEIGTPGQCACNPNEIEELRNELEIRDVNICGVGLKNGYVKDDDITASSFRDSNSFLPRYARLDRIGLSSSAVGGWLAGTDTAWECFVCHDFIVMRWKCKNTCRKVR